MNLLDEIRTDLVNESASLSNTLRKAKILASAIGLPEFREWVEFELNGYNDRERVPDYRRTQPANLGTFVGPFGSMAKNMMLPTIDLPDYLKDFAENMTFFEGVGELEALVTAQGPLYKKWPAEMVMLAHNAIYASEIMELAEVNQPIQKHVVSGILDQIKNRLLDFVLGLQESNVTSEVLDNRAVRLEVARSQFNINIQGDRNIVASGEIVNQKVKTVQKGDTDSLLNFLREHRIADDDIDEIKSAISAEPNAIDGRFGPRVRAWLGTMIEKAATGALNVSLNTAAQMLTQALNDYYGINPPT